MSQEYSGVIRAKWIVPIVTPPIENGWIRISGGKITEVGVGKPSGEVIDLGEVALLPRLINSHTHLEFSDQQTPVGQAGIAFPEWLKLVISTRGSANPVRTSEAIQKGVKELWDTGTVLAAEIATPPVDNIASSQELVIATFAEVLGLHDGRLQERLTAGLEHVIGHSMTGFSPHAPYSISRAGLDLVFKKSIEMRKPIAMHVAESPEERELLVTGKGSLADFLTEMGLPVNDFFPWDQSPFVSLIQRFADLPHTFLIHGNDLDAIEIKELARYPQITVVYCPRTHDFFRFPTHPLERLLKAGVRVALGTDSRVSNPDLSLWREIQFVLNHHQQIEPLQVLGMGTTMPAEAFRLAFSREIKSGQLSPGYKAEIGFVETSADNPDQLFSDLSHNDYQNLLLT